MTKAAKKPAKASGETQLKAIFAKYADKEVKMKEVRQLGHVFYHVDENAGAIKDLRAELKAVGYDLLVDRVGGDSIIEGGRKKEANRVVATVGEKGFSSSVYIVDLKVG